MKKIINLLLCLWAISTILATTAFAKEENVTVNPRGIEFGINGIATDDKVYFDTCNNENIPWYVLNKDGFLLSEYTLAYSPFREFGSGYYKGSDLQGYMDEDDNSLYHTLFTGEEQKAINKTDISCNDKDTKSPNVADKLYPLSRTI